MFDVVHAENSNSLFPGHIGFAGRIREAPVELEEGCLAQVECDTPGLQTSCPEISLFFLHDLLSVFMLFSCRFLTTKDM